MAERKKPRRIKGEGTVYWDERRQRWRGTADGVERSAKTKGDLLDKLKAVTDEAANTGPEGRRAAVAEMTVDQLFDRWIVAVIDGKKTRTRDSDVWRIGHLRTQLGKMRVTDLTVDDVDDALAAIFNRGVHAKHSLSLMRGTLRAALRFAVAREWVHRNVADVAVVPSGARAARRGVALTSEKYPGKLDELLAKVDARYRTLFTVQVEHALRPGEVGGLTLEAVNLEDDTLFIFQQMTYDDSGVALELAPVKTGPESRGVRTLKMTPRVVELLRPLVEARRLEQEVYPEWPQQWREVLFVTKVGTPHGPRNMRRALKNAAEEVGLGDLDFRRYDLRHTACQMLLDSGVPIDEVADYLGHDDLRMVRSTYSHKSGKVLDPRRSTPTEPS